jgi:cell wall-associated NlpC family hydrolase
MRAALACLAAALVLSGCGGAPVRHSIKPVPGDVVLREAKSQIGVPYHYGGRDPRTGFDCSGLVYYIYKKHDSILPRDARELYKLGDEVAKRDLKPGDLVFFDTQRTKPGHVGIFAGDGRFVHAPSTGGRVREDELENNYWKHAWMGARRIE